MKILILALLFFLLSSCSFEDIYLKCGEKEGYFNIVIGVTQSLNDKLESIGQDGDTVKVQVATSKYNDFASGDSEQGMVGEDSISWGGFYEGGYFIDRISGQAFTTKGYTKKYTFIGNCSKISKSLAKTYAGRVFVPPKKVKKKF